MIGHSTASRLNLDSMEDIRIQVARSPMASLVSLMADLYGGRRHGVPAQWRAAVGPNADDADVLRPLFLPQTAMFPTCVSPTGRYDAVDPEHDLDRIESLPGDELTAELGEIFGERLPEPWRPIADAPDRWLCSYAAVLRRTWTRFAPIWRQAGDLLDREVERVGTAAMGGALGAVVAGLGPRYRLREDSLHLDDRHPIQRELDNRVLVLVPVVSGTTPSLFDLDQPDFAWIGYSLPGVGGLHENVAAPAAGKDKLGIALGAVRTKILRTVEIPATMSALTNRIGCSASNTTYHCQQLEAAGLVIRLRRGSRVQVRLTLSGHQLLDLLS